ncbi:MAG: hypothetical protein KTR31_03290 [Myxococcales bacterium]|nr:hypothetical protein [Myxococcales bacterium]
MNRRRRRSLVGLRSLDHLPPVEEDEESTLTVLMTHVRDQLGEDDLTPVVAQQRAHGPILREEEYVDAVLVHDAVLLDRTPVPLDGSLLGPPPKIEYRTAHVSIAITMTLWMLVCALTATVAWTLWP